MAQGSTNAAHRSAMECVHNQVRPISRVSAHPHIPTQDTIHMIIGPPINTHAPPADRHVRMMFSTSILLDDMTWARMRVRTIRFVSSRRHDLLGLPHSKLHTLHILTPQLPPQSAPRRTHPWRYSPPATHLLVHDSACSCMHRTLVPPCGDAMHNAPKTF